MEYDTKKGIVWKWQAMDGAMTKAPLGGEKIGDNSADRGKTGTKRSLLTDGEGIAGTIGIPSPPLGVERTHRWLNRFRRILVRREKRYENYVARLHLSFALITFGKLFTCF